MQNIGKRVFFMVVPGVHVPVLPKPKSIPFPSEHLPWIPEAALGAARGFIRSYDATDGSHRWVIVFNNRDGDAKWGMDMPHLACMKIPSGDMTGILLFLTAEDCNLLQPICEARGVRVIRTESPLPFVW